MHTLIKRLKGEPWSEEWGRQSEDIKHQGQLALGVIGLILLFFLLSFILSLGFG